MWKKAKKAVDEKLVFHPYAGENINEYAKRIIGLFREVQRKVSFVDLIARPEKKNQLTIYGKFNEVYLCVNANSTTESIVKDFNERFKKKKMTK